MEYMNLDTYYSQFGYYTPFFFNSNTTDVLIKFQHMMWYGWAAQVVAIVNSATTHSINLLMEHLSIKDTTNTNLISYLDTRCPMGSVII